MSTHQGIDMVDQVGLPAIVVESGRTRATSEAARLLRLDKGTRSGELSKMFGLDVTQSASNPIARAVRGGCIVSDRMVVTDGAGRSRLLEVTTLPAKSDPRAMVILLRECVERRVARRPDPSEEPLRVSVAVPGRGRSRGLAPAIARAVKR